MASAQLDPELGQASARSSALPPDWIDKVTEIQYDFTKIKEKSKNRTSVISAVVLMNFCQIYHALFMCFVDEVDWW